MISHWNLVQNWNHFRSSKNRRMTTNCKYWIKTESLSFSDPLRHMIDECSSSVDLFDSRSHTWKPRLSLLELHAHSLCCIINQANANRNTMQELFTSIIIQLAGLVDRQRCPLLYFNHQLAQSRRAVDSFTESRQKTTLLLAKYGLCIWVSHACEGATLFNHVWSTGPVLQCPPFGERSERGISPRAVYIQ